MTSHHKQQAGAQRHSYDCKPIMLVTIALDHPHEHYTNLDVIEGRVFLRVPNPTNVSSIVVKLEGESKTRLLAPIHPSRPDKQRPVLEVHKVLYKTQVVWPANMTQDDLLTNNKSGFTMNAGNFEYPFKFKVSRTSSKRMRGADTNRYHSTPLAMPSKRPHRSPTSPSRIPYPNSRGPLHIISSLHCRHL